MGKPFFPKDKRIENIMDRLTISPVTYTKSDIAQQLGRYKEIRDLRKKDLIYIGNDRHKNVSIIFLKNPVKKKGKGFVF